MNHTAAALVLSRPSECGVTALTLHHLARDLDERCTVHVLMNGGFAGELRAVAPDSPRISYYSSPANLGVAGGRNYLLRLPEVQSSDYVIILDNDVITPPGHLHRLIDTLSADPEAGVIGPAILHMPAVARALELGSDDALMDPITNEQLTSLGGRLRDPSLWYHLGTHPDWRAVYIDELEVERELVARAGGSAEPFYAMNHRDPDLRAAVGEGDTNPISVTTVAGGSQAFRRDLLDEVGYLMDEFSPYGFEDVEFCIRVARTGRRNYVAPTIFMLHGTDQRQLARRSAVGVIASQRNFMRCKALLAWRHTNPTWEAVVEASILRRYVFARQAGRHQLAADQLRAHIIGAVDARRQIAHALSGRRNGGPSG